MIIFSCREKKDVEVHTLEGTKDHETNDWQKFTKENDQLRQEIENMKNRYLKIVNFAKKNNLKLKDRNVPISRSS